MRIRQRVTSRKTVLCIFLLLAFCCLIANIIPQRTESPASGASWLAGNTWINHVIRAAGLDHVFSTTWFVILALFFLLSLAISTHDQYRRAIQKTWGEIQETAPKGEVLVVPLSDFQKKTRQLGYIAMGSRTEPMRYVKHPWGHWGNFALHLGLALSVLFALVYVATEHRAIVRLIEGEQVYPTPDTVVEKKGLLAKRIDFPTALRLEKLDADFWDNDQLRALGSQTLFTAASGETKRIGVAINDKAHYNGMTVYQKNSFGTAFFLTMDDGHQQPFPETLFLPCPPRRDKAGYGTITLPDSGLTIKAKYFADAAKRNIYPVAPLLVLRLYDGERMVGETALQPGQSTVLGEYVVSLAKTAWWTDYLFEGSWGTFGIFTGFALILIGVVLNYFVVPRTVLVRQADDGYRVCWRTVRFPDLYAAEKEEIFAFCRGDLT